MKKKPVKSKSKASVRQPAKGCRRPSSCSPWERFQAAIKVVVRNLGGRRQFLIACGYIPSEWVQGYKRGFYISPHNPNIMWKAEHAVKDHFTRFRWHDRVLAAEAKYKANPDYPER